MTLNMFYDPMSHSLLHIDFTNTCKDKIYESNYTSYEQMVEIYMDLKRDRGFLNLPPTYEQMWETKPQEECIKLYRNIEDKINNNYKRSA